MEPAKDILTSTTVAKILKISRQRVQQLVADQILPARFVFNKQSKRKYYLFDRATVIKFSNAELRKNMEWVEPEESDLLSVPELALFLKCRQGWIYSMTDKGILNPSLLVGEPEGRMVYLYDKNEAVNVWKQKKKRGGIPGFRDETLEILEKIKQLNGEGKMDTEIAVILKKKQPQIVRLRKRLGLPPVCKPGRHVSSIG